METILDKIVGRNRLALEERKTERPLPSLKLAIAAQAPTRDFAAALRRGSQITPRLIAEIKRSSPSRGVLLADSDPAGIAAEYASGGASAISVVTERYFFGGSPDFIGQAKHACSLPVLRKDFVFDPYQIHETRALGADAVLLIVAILGNCELRDFLALAESLGMASLVEAHDEEEVGRAVEAGARIVGVNNRDLKSFAVDLETTRRLRPLVPADRLFVAESGIKGPSEVARLAEWGVDAMLVGEALVTAKDRRAEVERLLARSETVRG